MAIAVLLGPITLSGNSIVHCRDRTVCTISNTLHVFQEPDIVSNKLLFLFEGKAFEEIGPSGRRVSPEEIRFDFSQRF